MRQAGLKPKSHNSGVYWVRASANPNEGRSRLDDGDPNTNMSPKEKIIWFLVCVWGLLTWLAFTFIMDMFI